MQAVDVLGHNGAQLSRRLQLGQLFVGGVGLGLQAEHLVPVKAVEFLRPGVEKGAAEDLLRRVVVLLVVQPVHTAEIGDAALGGHPRPAEKDDGAALVHPLLQSRDLIGQGNPSLLFFLPL